MELGAGKREGRANERRKPSAVPVTRDKGTSDLVLMRLRSWDRRTKRLEQKGSSSIRCAPENLRNSRNSRDKEFHNNVACEIPRICGVHASKFPWALA